MSFYVLRKFVFFSFLNVIKKCRGNGGKGDDNGRSIMALKGVKEGGVCKNQKKRENT